MRAVLIAGGVIVGVFVTYLALYPYFQSRAESQAQAFCVASPIGSSVESAVTRAKDLKLVRHGYSEQQALFVASFQGAVLNAFICELAIAEGKVASRRVIADGD